MKSAITGFAIVLALFVWAVFSQASEFDKEVIGKVARIQGTAFAMQDAVPRKLALGADIMIGDVISTGRESRLQLRMSDDGSFSLGERTVFVVQDYVFKNIRNKSVLRLLSGAVNVVSGKLAQADSGGFRLETEVATIGIRGTKFWAGTLNGDVQVALWAGAVEIRNKAGQVVLDKPKFGATIRGGDVAPSPPRAWGAAKIKAAQEMTAFR